MALTANEYRRNFMASEEATAIKQELERMITDPQYNTRTFYTPLQDENLSFVEKHLAYLGNHPKLKPSEYLSNLRLMTKNRT
ncbi:MAG: hypothetical protein JWN82_391 [Candidatus Saccharibacteria bacterium]|nr:hypothetical protein [Candidatus Saccharibacteria bacterium]